MVRSSRPAHCPCIPHLWHCFHTEVISSPKVFPSLDKIWVPRGDSLSSCFIELETIGGIIFILQKEEGSTRATITYGLANDVKDIQISFACGTGIWSRHKREEATNIRRWHCRCVYYNLKVLPSWQSTMQIWVLLWNSSQGWPLGDE